MSFSNTKCIEIQRILQMCNKICEKYSWLLDAYVSDFYVYNHWQKLPKCWRESLEGLELESIGDIIDSNKKLQVSRVFPLSLLVLRQLIKNLQIPRKQQLMNMQVEPGFSLDNNLFSNYRFRNVFWRRVKLKKKHEIELISKMCYKLAIESNCHYIVDIGSGLGHLSRMLSYGYGLKVCSLEAQEYLTNEARKLDQEMEEALAKCLGEKPSKNSRPIHVNMEVKMSSDGKDILKPIKEAFGAENEDNIKFGIVGLHPCGDLGATLLRLFIKFPQVKFINIVGCCYMKLSESIGYPLSKFCKQKNYNLSYSSREVACHALEAYVEKLNDGQYWQLKIHAYRAALEKLIVGKWPHLFHSQVSSVKYCKDLTFSEYCLKAVAKLDIELNISKINLKEIQNDLENWKSVVIFYSLRLMIAPLVETIILLDRLLLILESGYECRMTSIFDPRLSPRNQVLMGLK